MSCCERTERTLLAAMTFVLPFTTTMTANDKFSAFVPAFQVSQFARSIEVLSPPPAVLITSSVVRFPPFHNHQLSAVPITAP